MTSWSWMVQQNRSMNIARRLGCRVLGLNLLTTGLHNTLRPVHWQAWWVVFPQRVRKVQSIQVPVAWGKGKINCPLLGDWSSFFNPGDCFFWSAPGFTLGGGIVTVVSVHPARRCTSPLGFVPVGLEDGVGHCHDVANLPRVRLVLFPFYIFFREKTLLFFPRVWFLIFCVLLRMLVADREPTPMLP